MSLSNGMAAINLEMSSRVPRTEYSAHFHWDLVKAVCGIEVGSRSSMEEQAKASAAFLKAWDYDFMWNILIHRQIFDGFCTSMGHAEYAQGGTDYDNAVNCPFKSPQQVLEFEPWEQYGQRDEGKLIKDFNQHYEMLCNDEPDL